MKKKTPNKDIFHLIIPLLTGIMIYLLYRGIPFLKVERLFAVQLNKNFLFYFMLYNLPDALWFYSLLITLKIIWNKQLFSKGKYWLYAVIIAVFFSEFAQKIKIIPGTFDVLDIVAYVIAYSVFIFRIHKNSLNYKINLT